MNNYIRTPATNTREHHCRYLRELMEDLQEKHKEIIRLYKKPSIRKKNWTRKMLANAESSMEDFLKSSFFAKFYVPPSLYDREKSLRDMQNNRLKEGRGLDGQYYIESEKISERQKELMNNRRAYFLDMDFN